MLSAKKLGLDQASQHQPEHSTGQQAFPHFAFRLCGTIIFLDQADDQVRLTGFLRSSSSGRLKVIAKILNFRADGCKPPYSWAGKNGAWARPGKITVLASLEPDQWRQAC